MAFVDLILNNNGVRGFNIQQHWRLLVIVTARPSTAIATSSLDTIDWSLRHTQQIQLDLLQRKRWTTWRFDWYSITLRDEQAEALVYSILKKLETRLIFDTQQQSYCVRKRWSDSPHTQGMIREAINTQGVGHVIDIWYSTDGDAMDIQYCLTEGNCLDDGQYCLTEGNRLDDGQINL